LSRVKTFFLDPRDRELYARAEEEFGGPFHWIDVLNHLKNKTLKLLRKKVWKSNDRKPQTLVTLENLVSKNQISGFYMAAYFYERKLSRWERLRYEKRVEEMTPDVIRGRKVLQGARRAGRNKNQSYRELRKLYQERANLLWKKRPGESKSQVARKIIKELKAEMNDHHEAHSVSPLAELLVNLNPDNPTNFHTIRRIIKPPQK